MHAFAFLHAIKIFPTTFLALLLPNVFGELKFIQCVSEKNALNLGNYSCQTWSNVHNVWHTQSAHFGKRCIHFYLFNLPSKCSDENDAIYTYSLTLFVNNGSIQHWLKLCMNRRDIMLGSLCQNSLRLAGEWAATSWQDMVQSTAAAGNTEHVDIIQSLVLNEHVILNMYGHNFWKCFDVVQQN